ncbi:MAG: hypothetical protein ACT4TC_23060 [Myxococcaceae bacterium]
MLPPAGYRQWTLPATADAWAAASASPVGVGLALHLSGYLAGWEDGYLPHLPGIKGAYSPPPTRKGPRSRGPKMRFPWD